MNKHALSRAGFTLVELLVVMALMAVLATLAIAFFPSALSSAREARAGTTLQGWLNVAKQRALRDRAPRGLRLHIANPGPFVGSVQISNAVTDCQYLETPDDFTGGTVQRTSNVPTMAAPYDTSNTLQITVPDGLQNGYSMLPADQPYWSVQPGDSIELLGSGLMYRITAVGVPTTVPVGTRPDYVAIDPPLPPGFLMTGTSNYRIVRSPRPAGDESLKMPADTIIDIATNGAYGNGLPIVTGPSGQYIDIVFGPSGQVIAPRLAGDKIHLWVRAPNPDDGVNGTNPFRGEPTLISIFARTGFVGAYPIAQPPSSPYVLVQ